MNRVLGPTHNCSEPEVAHGLGGTETGEKIRVTAERRAIALSWGMWT